MPTKQQGETIMENFEKECPFFMQRILEASKNLDHDDMKLITKFMWKTVQDFKSTAQYEFTPDPNYNKVCSKLFELNEKGKDTTKAHEEYEAIQEKQHKPLFERIEKFIKELLVPQHIALHKESKVLKYAIFDSLRSILSPYAKSASYTINDKDIKRREEKDPFSLGAQKEIVMTKTLNDDGTYNISYSSKTSDRAVIYDSKGNVIHNVGLGNDLGNVAKGLHDRGYNVRFIEENWGTKDCKGVRPAESVKSWVMRTRVDEQGKECEQELQDYIKTLGLPPVSSSI